MTLLQIRDSILSSLRVQFATKVSSVHIYKGAALDAQQLDAFLRDLANNAAQGFIEEETCAVCGRPTHASETNDDNLHEQCATIVQNFRAAMERL